jgi:uncharacterized membrane protein (UPF0127 family)
MTTHRLERRRLVWRGRLAVAGLLFALASCKSDVAQNAASLAEAPPSHVELRVKTSAGQTHRFSTELAVTEWEQQRGLSGRTSLADNAAMLFPFPYPKMASFWMKETLVPLDLLFIRSDGTVAEILPGEPENLQPLAANEPVVAVLEIRQGRAATLGIAAGDAVEWGNCADADAPVDVWRADRLCPSSAY